MLINKTKTVLNIMKQRTS